MISRCRLCGEDEVLVPQLTLDGSLALGEPFTLSRCAECGTWQVDPPLNQEFIQNYFQAPERWRLSYDPEGRPVDPAERAAARLGEYAKYAAALCGNLDHGGRVLDVGAGSGLMLSLLPEAFQKIAVEPNPSAAGLAAQKGLTVRGGWAEDLDFPLASLSGLIMNQTFDHLRDPAAFMDKAVHWLKPGGLMLLSGLINPDGLIPRLYGPRFRLWHPLYQVYPPPGAMVGLLGGHGFQVIRWWQPYLGTPYGSLRKLLRDSPDVLCHILGFGRDRISPPWPGNTYSLLARKALLTRPLKSAARKWLHPGLRQRPTPAYTPSQRKQKAG